MTEAAVHEHLIFCEDKLLLSKGVEGFGAEERPVQRHVQVVKTKLSAHLDQHHSFYLRGPSYRRLHYILLLSPSAALHC